MSLRVHATRNITVVKALNYKDTSLDPEKVRSVEGNYLRTVVFAPVQVDFKAGPGVYEDSDVQNAGEGDTIESVLKWPTMKAMIRKGILIPVRDIDVDDDDVEAKPKKAPKKAITFGEE